MLLNPIIPFMLPAAPCWNCLIIDWRPAIPPANKRTLYHLQDIPHHLKLQVKAQKSKVCNLQHFYFQWNVLIKLARKCQYNFLAQPLPYTMLYPSLLGVPNQYVCPVLPPPYRTYYAGSRGRNKWEYYKVSFEWKFWLYRHHIQDGDAPLQTQGFWMCT